MTLGDLLGVLRDAYCRTIGIEYMHIQDTDEQRWIQTQVEGAPAVVRRRSRSDRILERLNAAEAFEKFLATKYVGTKRFGLEGAESAIPILDEILSGGRRRRARLVRCIGMAHRGRLNVLSNIMGKSYDAIFSEFEGHVDPTIGAGLRRRQVPPRRDRQVREPVGRRHPPRAGRQPEPPRDRRPDRDGHGAGRPRTRSTRPARTRRCRS